MISPIKKFIGLTASATYAVTDFLWYAALQHKGIRVSEKWERWYAWHPVIIRGEHVWRKEIYRKAILYKDNEVNMFVYAYRYADDIDLIKGDD